MKAFLDAVQAAHVPDLDKQPGMVCQIWEDGEITLQKSGELMHRRSLHCIRPGKSISVALELMPVQMYNHGCAFIESIEKAEKIADLLK